MKDRTIFDPDVNSAYDADRDFIVSYINAHIIEMVLNFFNMESIHSKPEKHQPPDFDGYDDKKK